MRIREASKASEPTWCAVATGTSTEDKIVQIPKVAWSTKNALTYDKLRLTNNGNRTPRCRQDTFSPATISTVAPANIRWQVCTIEWFSKKFFHIGVSANKWSIGGKMPPAIHGNPSLYSKPASKPATKAPDMAATNMVASEARDQRWMLWRCAN